MDKMTLRRIGWVGASLGLTSVLVGCNPDIQADSEASEASGGVDHSSAYAESSNGLTTMNGFNSSNGINAAGLFLPANAAGYQVGTVVWHVNAGANTDGVDILSGLFAGAANGFGGAGYNDIDPNTLVFNGASVNVVPEPGTAALLGFGLVGLILAGRRNRA